MLVLVERAPLSAPASGARRRDDPGSTLDLLMRMANVTERRPAPICRPLRGTRVRIRRPAGTPIRLLQIRGTRILPRMGSRIDMTKNAFRANPATVRAGTAIAFSTNTSARGAATRAAPKPRSPWNKLPAATTTANTINDVADMPVV